MTTYGGHLGTWQQQPGSGSAKEHIEVGMFQWFTHLKHQSSFSIVWDSETCTLFQVFWSISRLEKGDLIIFKQEGKSLKRTEWFVISLTSTQTWYSPRVGYKKTNIPRLFRSIQSLLNWFISGSNEPKMSKIILKFWWIPHWYKNALKIFYCCKGI